MESKTELREEWILDVAYIQTQLQINANVQEM